jgi:hypothetical protein
MTRRAWYALGALGAVAVLAALPFGCASGDESTSPTTTDATHAGGGGHGGSAGHGGGGHGAAGGGGEGGAFSVAEACDQACPASVACGQGGAGGGSDSWPPNLQDCLTGCQLQLAHCSSVQLAKAIDCLTPAIDPHCDLAAFTACLGDDAACLSTGSGGAGA